MLALAAFYLLLFTVFSKLELYILKKGEFEEEPEVARLRDRKAKDDSARSTVEFYYEQLKSEFAFDTFSTYLVEKVSSIMFLITQRR